MRNKSLKEEIARMQKIAGLSNLSESTSPTRRKTSISRKRKPSIMNLKENRLRRALRKMIIREMEEMELDETKNYENEDIILEGWDLENDIEEIHEEEEEGEDSEEGDDDIVDLDLDLDLENDEEDMEFSGGDDIEGIQQDLEGALEKARGLGDEKLVDQIGNTITFFTRAHVVKRDESPI